MLHRTPTRIPSARASGFPAPGMARVGAASSARCARGAASASARRARDAASASARRGSPPVVPERPSYPTDRRALCSGGLRPSCRVVDRRARQRQLPPPGRRRRRKFMRCSSGIASRRRISSSSCLSLSAASASSRAWREAGLRRGRGCFAGMHSPRRRAV